MAARAPDADAVGAAHHTPTELNLGDRLFRFITTGLAASIVVVLFAIAIELAIAAMPAVRAFGFGFVVGTDWDPVRDHYGALPFIFGTVVSSLLALLISVPIALGVAIFLTELAPEKVRGAASFFVELLAAVPSVVYGLWGVFVVAPVLRDDVEPWLEAKLGFLPFFRGPGQGIGMLAASVILAVMILPTISSVSREVLKSVPITLKEGALALGATRWEMLRGVVLPYARSGIIGAIILGLGRALGETMAVTMVIGNRAEISASVFAPSYTMASVIANEFTEATGDLYVAALAEIALLLFVVTLVLNMLARLLVRAIKVPQGGRT